ncbi:MAG: hypothetical protein HQM16_08895 [Deltaproteobacteria bacterium]|nr:hypothetical protein [Deltaproteobacteria bacterium]
MKKILAIIALLLVLFFLFYRRPDTTDPSAVDLDNLASEIKKIQSEIEGHATTSEDNIAVVKVLLSRFEDADQVTQKALYALFINFSGGSLEVSKAGLHELTTRERSLYDEARDMVKTYVALDDSFERGLLKSEIEYITQDNPDSVYRRLNAFIPFASAGFKCDKQDLKAVVHEVGAENLKQRASSIAQIAQDYELLFYGDYLFRKLELIKRESLYDKYRPALDVYYTMQLLSREKREEKINRDLNDRIERTSQKLIRTGVPQNEIRDFVYRAVNLAPACLVGLDVQIYNWIGEEVTLERGNKLIDLFTKPTSLKNIKDITQKIKSTPINQMTVLDYVSSDPGIKTTDAWLGSFYTIKKDDDACALYSQGKDKKDPHDDLFIGEFYLK